MNTLGKRLRYLRKENGLTQEQLADIFLLNKSSISRYEKGHQVPEIDTLNQIADFFDVSIDYLLGRTNTKQFENITEVENIFEYPNDLSSDEIKEINDYIKFIVLKRAWN